MDYRDSKCSWMGEQWRRYEESQATLGVIFAGIAALFIAGIAAAFIYAKDTNPTQTASAPAPAASTTASAPPIASIPETTGSGARETTGSGNGINYIPPKRHPREDEQREQP